MVLCAVPRAIVGRSCSLLDLMQTASLAGGDHVGGSLRNGEVEGMGWYNWDLCSVCTVFISLCIVPLLFYVSGIISSSAKVTICHKMLMLKLL